MTGFCGRRRCKTYAVPKAGSRGAGDGDAACEPVAHCAKLSRCRRHLTQGNPGRWIGLLAALVLAPAAAGAAAPPAVCPGPVLRIETLSPGRWWVPAQAGEADARNRGQVSNLVLAADPVDSRRLWLLGSGPSPAFGRALACQLQRQLGRRVTDVVSPWARPELVLGVTGLGPVRHWAHADVAAAMAEQCPHCVERLRARLGPAAVDLGPAPIPPSPPASRQLRGDSGTLGPWRWWRLPRSAGRGVTVWQAGALWFAPGLLNGSGPPDGRDADLGLLAASAGRLAMLAPPAATAHTRFIGEQGPPMDGDAPRQHQAYWQELLAQARAAIERGDSDTAPALAWPGLPPAWASHPWHALNWQRAWRQVEPEVLAAPVK